VESAPAALEALRNAESDNRPYRLIITAADLPNTDGFALAEIILGKSEYGNAVIMMLNSSGIRGDSSRCRKLGLRAYLTKPIKPSMLLDAIRMALGTPPALRPEMPLITKHSLLQSDVRLDILLAEDNPVNQKLATRVLTNHGHRVTVAGDGESALSALETGRFDLVIMDVMMPGLDGFQTTVRIRQREKERGGHIPIIAMTANAMAGDREKCLAAGMDDYVSKPLKPVTLYRTIERVMETLKEKTYPS
jgi:two-component system sensor histidine kinase/response regulator